MEVKIIRSRRRFRTVSARLVKDILVVRAPQLISNERLEQIVGRFKSRFERQQLKTKLDKEQDLDRIAKRINAKYFHGSLKINSISYVTNQNSKYGCCNCQTGDIRVSHKVGLMPEWVREYVVIHEMAHLIEPNHGKAFWDIVYRYALAERARGYLMAAGINFEEMDVCGPLF